MRRTVILLAMAFSIVISSPAFAACEDILRYVNYNQNEQFRSRTNEEINQSRFCSMDVTHAQGADRTGIQLSYAGFGLGFTNDTARMRAEQHARCNDRFGFEYNSGVDASSSRQVSQAALDAVTRCEQAQAGRFILEHINSGDRSFNASFKWGGTGPMAFSGIVVTQDVAGHPAADCSATSSLGGPLVPGTNVAPNETFVVSCRQLAMEAGTSDDGERVRRYPNGVVTVGLQSGSIDIPVPERADLLVQTSRVAALESQNQALVAALAQLQARLTTLETRRYRLRAGNMTNSGWYQHDQWRGCGENMIVRIRVGQNDDFGLSCAPMTIEPVD